MQKCRESDKWFSTHFLAHIGHWAHYPFTWTHQTVESLHVYMHLMFCMFTCTLQVHVNVQWPVCLTCALKCAESKTIDKVQIFMNTSVNGLTAQLHEHIRQSDHCTFTCTHQVDVNVQWPECLTCACKCAESQTIRSVHIFMHTSAIGLTAQLHEHIRQSDHCTFTCTHQVHVNVQWPECLTGACKCAESQTIGSLHIFMHTSVIGLTAQLHEHIRRSDHCTFTCTHQVHVNVQWPECLHYWIYFP